MSSETNDISFLYPPPPPYIKFFTKENLNKLPEYKEQKHADPNTNFEVKQDGDEKIESSLDFLIPPPMPKEQYRAFGSIWQVRDRLPDLEASGLTQLYKKSDENKDGGTGYQYKIQELRRLLKSLLLNYLELVGMLSVNPELFPSKVDHIRIILVNIHHLLNEYRPHQSRESLIMLLEEQLEFKKREIQHIEQICQHVREKLGRIQEGGQSESGGGAEVGPVDELTAHMNAETNTN
ncbi:mediator of RNA polymerase II transcription subunit 7 [Zygosaccharomyces mellis]|uniref:Mediator of RNA polymerase II transcription subunit 7 n=1 Tax=Zygosaccharomyces mellis TaxID=42258 RepID=A0A4C2EAR8_9SACH|nr:mediator of RNA polymerase II transcription subunit 7 [Zygosaccharomyces mellis]